MSTFCIESSLARNEEMAEQIGCRDNDREISHLNIEDQTDAKDCDRKARLSNSSPQPSSSWKMHSYHPFGRDDVRRIF